MNSSEEHSMTVFSIIYNFRYCTLDHWSCLACINCFGITLELIELDVIVAIVICQRDNGQGTLDEKSNQIMSSPD